jgi:MFS transporter, DHA2 family, multidrug resistance protein
VSVGREIAGWLGWHPAAPRDHSLCHPADKAAQTRPLASLHPFIGTFAVLLGSVIATLDSRITVFGLADVRGGVHAGFDEGAWITTALTVGQMMIGPPASWLGAVFGVRRVLEISAAVFAISNFLLPFSPNLHWVLFYQFVSGLSSGTFIPLTIGFVVLNLPPRLVVFGVAAYALNLELSLNIAASIEGWFDDHWNWHWIFWDTALLAPVMLLCIRIGMPRQPINRELLKSADWAGLLYASLGFSILYAALDQGNRLNWLQSGLISALLLGGVLLLVAFAVQELTSARPWINLRYAASGNIPLLFLLITFFRFALLSTAYIIPQFLVAVQGYRAVEVGSALLWIALPQFIIAPATGFVLRYIDPRFTLALGFALVAVGCFMGGQLTDNWIGSNFLGGLLVQALGQSIGLTSLVWFFLRHLEPSEVLTFGAVLQTGRLFGAQLGSAFVQTFVRVREQIASNLVGQHVTPGSFLTDQRLQDYAHAVAGRSVGAPAASARAEALLAHAVQNQANVLSYIDGFMIIGFAAMVVLALMLTLRDPPPSSLPIFSRD